MSKCYGYIKLYRDIQEHFLWQEKPYDKARAWLDLIMLANHTERKTMINGRMQLIRRGQVFTSRKKLAERWGWSIKKVDGFINLLKTEEMVTAEATPEGTTLTVEKYGLYQSEGKTEDTAKGTSEDTTEDTPEDTTEETTEDTQTRKLNNYNNEKNEKKGNITGDFAFLFDGYDEKIRSLLFDWLDIHYQKKGCISESSVEQNLGKLNQFSKESEMTVEAYLEEVIRRGWATFYPIKPSEKPKTERAASYDLAEAEKADLKPLVYRRKNDKSRKA